MIKIQVTLDLNYPANNSLIYVKCYKPNSSSIYIKKRTHQVFNFYAGNEYLVPTSSSTKSLRLYYIIRGLFRDCT